MTDAAMGREPRHEVDALDAFISRLTGEKPSLPDLEDGLPLDPSLVETARRVHALDRDPRPDPVLGDRLWGELMREDARSLAPSAPVKTFGLNGQRRLAPGSSLRPPPEIAAGKHRRRPVWLAAAAVLIVLAGSLLVIRGGWPGSGEDDQRGSIPAPLVSPAPSPTATPPAGPVEFLWQSRGDPAAPIQQGTRLDIAPDGSIWIPDAKSGRFHIFAPDGAFLETWGSAGSGEGQFNFTAEGFFATVFGAIAFAPDGSFYVADTGNHRVQKFGPDRAFLFAWGTKGSADGQFLDPVDLDLDASGRVFVADLSRGIALNAPQVGAIQVFDADGRFLMTWGDRGSDPGQLLQPTGLGIDRDGNVLITERMNHRLQRFTPEGAYLGGWGKPGSTEGRFDDPFDVAGDAHGRVYVLDGANARIQIFDQDGRFLALWGGYGNAEGQFAGLAGFVLDDDGNVYAADAGRLQKFRLLPLPEPGATPAP